MTIFITMKHKKNGDLGRMPEQTEQIWNARGWQRVKDPDGVGPNDPILPEQAAAELADAEARAAGEAPTP
jgi:hypothetical protein